MKKIRGSLPVVASCVVGQFAESLPLLGPGNLSDINGKVDFVLRHYYQ